MLFGFGLPAKQVALTPSQSHTVPAGQPPLAPSQVESAPKHWFGGEHV
jgi:hypothetical protein